MMTSFRHSSLDKARSGGVSFCMAAGAMSTGAICCTQSVDDGPMVCGVEKYEMCGSSPVLTDGLELTASDSPVWTCFSEKGPVGQGYDFIRSSHCVAAAGLPRGSSRRGAHPREPFVKGDAGTSGLPRTGVVCTTEKSGLRHPECGAGAISGGRG